MSRDVVARRRQLAMSATSTTIEALRALRGGLIFLWLLLVFCDGVGNNKMTMIRMKQPALADEVTHAYNSQEEVLVYANKIGPFNNPLETYPYFDMHGCPPASKKGQLPSLGQALAGDDFYKMATHIEFNKNVDQTTLCTFTPTKDALAKWRSMVDQQYWYQLTADDLPMWATLGKVEGGVAYINTLQHFSFGVKDNQIVSVNLTVDAPVALDDSVATKPIVFTYSANFEPSTDIPFERRYDRYLDNSFFEHHIHWFSIVNSFMAVCLLIGFVIAILHRTLKNDYARFSAHKVAEEAEQEDWIEDHGWKQLQYDVFRVPPSPVLLSSLVGTGCQLATMFVIMTIISLCSASYTIQGAFVTYAVFLYVLTSYIAGFASATLFSYYSMIGPAISTQWMRCMLTTALLFPGTLLALGFVLNFVALANGSAQAVGWGGVATVLLLWIFVATPLVILGTVMGRHSKFGGSSSMRQELPRVNQIPRMIPSKRCLSRRFLAFASGVMPFFSIIVELYYIFTSFWNYKVYYVYGFLLLVILIFLVMTACVSITTTYVLLNGEDHRWQWTSFGGGASTGLYMFMYAVFFWSKSRMDGLFMFAFYFTYSAMMALAIAILCGTVAFVVAHQFVTAIYRSVKED